MDQPTRKASILAAAKAHLETTISELKERIADLRSVTMGDENAESASQTESRRGSDVDLMDSLSDQLAHVKQDLERVQDINPAVRCDVVQYGAVVHTETHAFLIAASMDDFEVDGVEYLGVTPKAPVIAAMSGMSKGDSTTVNDMKYTVLEVF